MYTIYSYLLPKIFSRKSLLLSKRDFKELGKSKTLSEFIRKLREKPYYRKVFENREKIFTPLQIKDILEENLIYFEKNIILLSENMDFLLAYFHRHLIPFLKVIFRNLFLGKNYRFNEKIFEEIISFLNMEDFYRELCQRKNIWDIFKMLIKYYKIEEKIVKINDIYFIDTFLEKIFYKYLLKKFYEMDPDDRNVLVDFIKILLMKYNVIAITYCNIWDIGLEISEKILLKDKLIEENIDRFLYKLDKTLYKHFKEKRVDLLEKDFDLILIRCANRFFLKDVFSIAPLLGIIFLVENEINNLIKISYLISSKNYDYIPIKIVII